MREHADEITGKSVIDWVLTRYPDTAPVFLRWKMQCVGCPIARFESIDDACRIYRRPVDRFLAELRQACFSVHPVNDA
jgi:hybrid cluster-associated redox disulfide protein